MSDLKINFPVKVPQGLNVMSNEARTKTIRDIESKVLDDMGLPKDTFSQTKASKSKVSQFLENVKGNKILTKRKKNECKLKHQKNKPILCFSIRIFI